MRLEYFRLEGPGKEETLDLFYVLDPEEVHLGHGFHALGESLEAEVPAELDERGHQSL